MKGRIKVVLDTNVLLRCVSRRSAYASVIDKLYNNVFDLFITNDIQLEYEEKIAEIFSTETAEVIISAFLLLQNVHRVDVHFHLELINSDKDDNKFSDCAFSANVHFLVTDDKLFNILKKVDFPAINVITLDQFNQLLSQ